jgi:hypothetical protein
VRHASHPVVFAVIYTLVSLATEIVLLVVFRLKIPQHNFIIAPIVLTVPPLITAWLAGYRSSRSLLICALLTSILTLIVTIVVTRATGVSVGLREPIISRSIAGFVAAWLTRLLVRQRQAAH